MYANTFTRLPLTASFLSCLLFALWQKKKREKREKKNLADGMIAVLAFFVLGRSWFVCDFGKGERVAGLIVAPLRYTRGGRGEKNGVLLPEAERRNRGRGAPSLRLDRPLWKRGRNANLEADSYSVPLREKDRGCASFLRL